MKTMTRNNRFPEYTTDYITNAMSLRKPQKRSLEILDSIVKDLDLRKDMDLDAIASDIHDIYPTFKGFDRGFMNLAFALATGVGKTRLMGVFITYLYTHFGIHDFLVVAPSLTIYNKLVQDLGNPGSPKYVFNGLGCFNGSVNVFSGDDYLEKSVNAYGVRVFVFNAQKFNSDKENRKMNRLNEGLGQSFIEFLSSLDDLVVIMDEAHHYRHNETADALERIHPLLGLELTATPYVASNNKKKGPEYFDNVVYDYPLAKSIRDGYTRTPYVMTRSDLLKSNLSDEEKDRMALIDGINWHEEMKRTLAAYAKANDARQVKPFMLVVCANIDHAKQVLDFIKSDSFHNGDYKDKVIEVDSGKSGLEKDENIQKLLDVENPENKVEIVVHVNMLKEGWDVSNLYTIVPLRTANSRLLIEQTIGRGLRLPYGRRIGDKWVDSVMMTAHDNFKAVVEEANSADSILRKENIIDVKDLHVSEPIQASVNVRLFDAGNDDFYENNRDIEKKPEHEDFAKKIMAALNNRPQIGPQMRREKGIDAVADRLKEEEPDLAKIVDPDNEEFYKRFLGYAIDRQEEASQTATMAIPRLEVESEGDEECFIDDFVLDVSNMNYTPIPDSVLIQNLLKSSDQMEQKTIEINFRNENPAKTLIDVLRRKPLIDYDAMGVQIAKLILQFFEHLQGKGFDEDSIRNIVFANKKDIANKIYEQISRHIRIKSKGLIEYVSGIDTKLICPVYSTAPDGSNVKSLFDQVQPGDIRSLVFKDGRKSVLNLNKFDSDSERIFALVCDRSEEVIKWLRPAPNQFNIHYDHGKRYEPDFVVETKDCCYLVEIKAVRDEDDRAVLAKKAMAVKYCKLATDWCKANGHKPWKHLFIPHDRISISSTFEGLKKAFVVTD